MIKCNNPCPTDKFEGCCFECDLKETCIEVCGFNPFECDDSVIMDDMFQVDYLPDEKKIKINLPEEVWKNIDTVILTRLFKEELVVEKQKEGFDDEDCSCTDMDCESCRQYWGEDSI